MYMRTFFCAILLICATTSWAQSDPTQSGVPDINSVDTAITNPQSPFYYPTLMMRYNTNDTTLSVEDYFYLYYGYAFQQSYKPMEGDQATTQILEVFDKNPEPDVAQAQIIIEAAHQVMKYDPFSIKNLNFLVYAYGIIGDGVRERIYFDKMEMIIAAIRLSGTGLTEKSPWHVLYFYHALDMIATMGLQAGKEMVVSPTVEYIPLLIRNGDTKGYYFNFERVYWNKPDNYKPKRSTGMKFNNLK